MRKLTAIQTLHGWERFRTEKKLPTLHTLAVFGAFTASYESCRPSIDRSLHLTAEHLRETCQIASVPLWPALIPQFAFRNPQS